MARRRRTAMVAATALVIGGVALPAGAAQAAPACDVTYATSDWNNGFTATVTIKNLGDALNNWSLKFAFPNSSQRVTQGWSAKWSQSGSEVTATNESWNGSLPTGASTSIGFNGSYSGSNPKPTAFTLNGVACNGAQTNQPPTVSLSVPSGPFEAPADVPLTATASDSDGTISKVEFYRNGLLVNTDTTAPYGYDLLDLPAGSYTVQAKAYDNAGGSAVSEKSFTVTAASGPKLVANPSAVTVAEGDSATVRYTLSAAPTANVPVTLAVTGDSDITVSPSTLTLTSSNWSTGVTATVSAAEDSDTVGGTATITASATGYAPISVVATEADNDTPGGDNDYIKKFLDQYGKIKNSGYFSPEGVPYHSIETLIVEAPDHGHETTSEAFSFWLWLEAQYGRVTQNWAPFNNAWTVMEKYIIPNHSDQATAGSPGTPQYAAEHNLPSQYPSALDANVPVGQDPLRSELQSTYGTGDIYGMHWLLDVDNTYGFGRCGDGTTRPAYINTFQRGTQESVWETVPQPSCDTFKHGGPNGYLDLFVKESSAPAKQWKYTNAPDADARAVQAAYWALTWAKAQGKQADVAATVAKAAKMGDYLRYALFDKYFKKIGNCVGASTCPAASGRDSAHYLLSWYYAWGGAYDASQNWSWRIGSSHSHFGYQNPFAAWAMTNVAELKPKSPTAVSDWQKSLDRQLEFYTWLQSAEGGIAGGATNSWDGSYAQPPTGTATFYGMYYDVDPVYNDPPSNQWFGMQAWSMQRIAELYLETGNAKAKALLDKWVPWAIANTTVGTNWSIPSDMKWTGQPANWNPSSPQPNTNLHVEVTVKGQDVGVAGAYARTLIAYAAKSGNTAAKNTAKGLLDALSASADSKGVSTPEKRGDYKRFDDVYNAADGQGLYVPNGWTGKMPNGDAIAPGKSFLDIRSFYKNDPDWPKVQAYLDGGPEPVFNYHRFWAQADIAMAYADYGTYFPQG
ncbi:MULTISPECIES: glycoside hydrolase family 48 protein [unclassified Micromonospora]|uniref:glycoside hydrolase family 48 protein n=1 Tax=unclassified Micromonospora TaxID=2617518 RepID=UPI00188FC4BD|nr:MULTISPECIES: glycoside hydrolase family 48 protein [unclassified Micromonospora]MBF5033534.1 cellulose binding domain-containing protein [Micromonospora sp. ANENR4]MCZ7476303.1 cellulose binding domain-containing protein [Micromonospora sp. WMMC273]WBC06447.1 cellulose binding domain-containing protein [Micromonospora sp. WMMA1976]